MDELFGLIDDWFLSDPSQLERAAVLAMHGRQREGWFTTEMMVCFQTLLGNRRWHPEVRVPDGQGGNGPQVDFWLRWGDLNVFIEVKAPLIGRQRPHTWNGAEITEGTAEQWKLSAYAYAHDVGGLRALTGAHKTYLVLFACGSVDQESAKALAQQLNECLEVQAIQVAHHGRSRGPQLSIIWFDVAS